MTVYDAMVEMGPDGDIDSIGLFHTLDAAKQAVYDHAGSSEHRRLSEWQEHDFADDTIEAFEEDVNAEWAWIYSIITREVKG